MHVAAFDHINIHTADVLGTAQFHAEVLGLKPSQAAGSFPMDKAQWLLDSEGRAIIHLYAGTVTPGATGPIHHVALNCVGKMELIERLKKRKTQFDVFEASGETRVFTRDPHGILLELYFYGD
jgi:catechol 2,3-dioxygenase-like lactoylglutathione lyase family enzyme